jgi:hypothetical protein
MPVGRNHLYCYADLVIPATEDPTGRDLDRFRALFADFGEPVRSILSRLENFASIHFSPIEEIVLDSSICGRVVLLGDAAHATSPNMAEGASMALEDALVLAQMLAMHGSPDEALSEFSERRRTRIRWVQQRTHRRIASGLCRFRSAIAGSDWQGQPFISEIIECCSRSHSNERTSAATRQRRSGSICVVGPLFQSLEQIAWRWWTRRESSLHRRAEWRSRYA